MEKRKNVLKKMERKENKEKELSPINRTSCGRHDPA